MKIACIGTGFVGVVTSAVFAKLGHQVTGLDIDENKVRLLSEGNVPFYEPGLSDLLAETLASGNLSYTTSYKDAISEADVVFIMVGTPSAPDGQADLKYVFAAAESMAPFLKKDCIVVLKSTVPAGTNQKVEELIKAKSGIEVAVASAPEFLKEGSAVEDTLHPARVIIGSTEPRAIEVLKELHRPLSENIIVMRPESAQLAKYASNTYLAQRITFINQIANVCEKTGADIEEVIKGMGADPRIGSHYWYPGLGYGGSCYPKDVKELAAYSRAVGDNGSLFIKIDELNESRIPLLMKEYENLIGGFTGKTIAVLGLSFKPNTTDTREAPALKVIPHLLKAGAKVRATDPKAIEEAKKILPEDVIYAIDPYEAISGAHAVFLLIEWPEYQGLDMSKLASSMLAPKIFFDTRNQYQLEAVEKAGLKYKGVGR